MVRNRMRVQSAKTVRTDEIRDKMWYARYALTKAENKMNAQGVNGKLMEDAQRSSSGRGIFCGVKWHARPVDKVGAISQPRER
jgi:hypothetical protein